LAFFATAFDFVLAAARCAVSQGSASIGGLARAHRIERKQMAD
jgi:hypothetical protein